MSASTRPAHTPRYASSGEVIWRLPRDRRSVRRARTALRRQLELWHIGEELADTAELLLSELTTNAINAPAPRGRQVHLRFQLSASALRLEVADASDRLPVLKHAKGDEECGRGLELVEVLADGWGVDLRANGVGKTVWAVLALPGVSEASTT